jgi:GT2 family glycosyltransferase
VAAALEEGADFVAFVDDDEVPTPRWLDELMRAAGRGADVVTGPVVRHFEGDPPQWVRSGGFFLDPRRPTGTPVEFAATSNVLVARRVLEGVQPAFDLRFGLTGGEDTHFFLRAARAGYSIRWCDEAVVDELVPASRTRLGWILRRAYRLGNTWSRCERELGRSASVLAVRAGKALARMGLGAALLAASLGVRRHVAARGLWHIAFGAGNLTGLVGVRTYEYRQPVS